MTAPAQPMDGILRGPDTDLRHNIIGAVGEAIQLDISGSIIDGEILLTIDGAPQVDITVHDKPRAIVRSGILWDSEAKLRSIDVLIDGIPWRLVSIKKSQDDLALTFELLHVARLRQKFGPRKAASRALVTRAEYVLALVRSIQGTKIPVFIPDLYDPQPIAGSTDRAKNRTTRDQSKARGFAEGSKVGGLGKGELRNVEIAMEVWNGMKVSERAIMAGIVAGFGESGWKKSAHNDVGPGHDNIFQSDTIRGFSEDALREQAKYFMIGGKSYRAGGAVEYIKDHPYATLGEVAAKVEISDGSEFYYNTFRSKAKKVYDAYHGGGGSATSQTLYKKYEYKVEKDEAYWDAIQRLAGEVNWHAFFSVLQGQIVFFYASEKKLMEARALYTVNERTKGVSNIDFDQNHRKRAQKATVYCRLDRWKAPPGSVIIIDDLNQEGSQRWLVESIRRGIFSPEAEINCKRALPSKKEPAPEDYQKSRDSAAGGLKGDRRHAGNVYGPTDHNLTSEMLQLLQEIAGATNERIEIFDNAKHDKYTTGGKISNHYSGNAADIIVGGDARTSAGAMKKGNNIAIAALVVCGVPRREAEKMLGGPRTSFQADSSWNGYDIEIGWRTMEGGNHFNHVHVGLDHGGIRVRDPKSGSPTKMSQDWNGANP